MLFIVLINRQSYITEIPIGNTLLSVSNINPCDEQTAVFNYYQYNGLATPEDQLYNELLTVWLKFSVII
jgi:hypothetical protein